MPRAVVLLTLLAGCALPEGRVASFRGAALAPDAGGLQPAGTELRIDFGRIKAGVVEAVTRLLGASPVSETINRECAAGPVNTVSWAGLELTFMDGDFLGWVLDDAAFATADGIRPGMTRAALEAAGVGPFEVTSLGVDFEANGIFGFLEQGTPDAPLIEMSSGLRCSVR